MVFAGGTILYAAGKIYTRAQSVEANGAAARPTWLEAAGVENDAVCDTAARIDLIERLAIVGEPWCVETLRAAQRDEREPAVRKAITSALKSSPSTPP